LRLCQGIRWSAIIEKCHGNVDFNSFSIIKVEKKAYDDIVATIDKNKADMDLLASETMEFVNKAIVAEQIPVGKVSNNTVLKKLKKAAFYNEGTQDYKTASTITDTYCPRDTNKKPTRTKRRDSYAYCERGGFIKLNGVDSFFSIDILGGTSMDGHKFTKSGADNWKHLAKITKEFKSLQIRLYKGNHWVKGGDLYEAEKVTDKAYRAKVQIALNTTGMQYSPYRLLDRGYYHNEVKKRTKAINKNEKLLEKSSSESSKKNFVYNKLSPQNRMIKKLGESLGNSLFDNYLTNLNGASDFQLGDTVSLASDTRYVILVGEVIMPPELKKPNVSVSIAKYVSKKEGEKQEILALDFDKFQLKIKKSWLNVFLLEQAKHLIEEKV
jgi:hypothetical protein